MHITKPGFGFWFVFGLFWFVFWVGGMISFKFYFYFCVCAYVSVWLHARRLAWIPWNYSYRQLWAAQCSRCWEPNPGSLKEHHTILTEPVLQQLHAVSDAETRCCCVVHVALQLQSSGLLPSLSSWRHINSPRGWTASCSFVCTLGQWGFCAVLEYFITLIQLQGNKSPYNLILENLK